MNILPKCIYQMKVYSTHETRNLPAIVNYCAPEWAILKGCYINCCNNQIQSAEKFLKAVKSIKRISKHLLY